jgi:hypothetical protein
MAALVQAYPQQSSTVTMLQTRPSSASGIIHTSQPAAHHPYPMNQQRNSFHGMLPVTATANYRGHTTMAPIAPYAFTSTPNLAMPGQRSQPGPHLRPEFRTSSAPIIPAESSFGNNGNRSRYPAPASISTTSSTSSSDVSSMSQKSGSKDDLAITGTARGSLGMARPQSTIIPTTPGQLFPSPSASSLFKPAPDRYRRPNNRRPDSTSTQTSTPQPASISSTTQTSIAISMPNVMQFYGSSTQPKASPPVLPMPALQSFTLQMPQLPQLTGESVAPAARSTDDLVLNRHVSQDQAKRYRRRSIHTIDVGEYGGSSAGLLEQGSRQVSSANGRIDHGQHPLRSSPVTRPGLGSSHGRNGSTESTSSARSNHSRPSSVREFLNLNPSSISRP